MSVGRKVKAEGDRNWERKGKDRTTAEGKEVGGRGRGGQEDVKERGKEGRIEGEWNRKKRVQAMGG